mgnify:CR=1 FL=1
MEPAGTTRASPNRRVMSCADFDEMLFQVAEYYCGGQDQTIAEQVEQDKALQQWTRQVRELREHLKGNGRDTLLRRVRDLVRQRRQRPRGFRAAQRLFTSSDLYELKASRGGPSTDAWRQLFSVFRQMDDEDEPSVVEDRVDSEEDGGGGEEADREQPAATEPRAGSDEMIEPVVEEDEATSPLASSCAASERDDLDDDEDFLVPLRPPPPSLPPGSTPTLYDWLQAHAFSPDSSEYLEVCVACDEMRDVMRLAGHPDLDAIVAGWKPLRKRRFLRAIGADEDRIKAAVPTKPEERRPSPKRPAPDDPPRGFGFLGESDNGFLKRRRRCRVCEACRADNCGECYACKDKPEFGGPGTQKQACVLKRCTNMTVEAVPLYSANEPRDVPAEATLREQLGHYLEKQGGDASMLAGWSFVTETRRFGDTAGDYDVYYITPGGGRLRSRVDVARHFGLVRGTPKYKK